MRIAVYDVLDYLASEMSEEQILACPYAGAQVQIPGLVTI